MDDVRPLVRSSTRHELDEAPAPSLQVIDTVKHDEPNPVPVATDKVALVTGTRLPVVWSIGRLPCDCVGDSIVRRGLALVLGKMLLKCADIRSPQRAFTRHGPC
jgi:hypothetical protein